jgi:hypothetical protein
MDCSNGLVGLHSVGTHACGEKKNMTSLALTLVAGLLVFVALPTLAADHPSAAPVPDTSRRYDAPQGAQLPPCQPLPRPCSSAAGVVGARHSKRPD